MKDSSGFQGIVKELEETGTSVVRLGFVGNGPFTIGFSKFNDRVLVDLMEPFTSLFSVEWDEFSSQHRMGKNDVYIRARIVRKLLDCGALQIEKAPC